MRCIFIIIPFLLTVHGFSFRQDPWPSPLPTPSLRVSGEDGARPSFLFTSISHPSGHKIQLRNRQNITQFELVRCAEIFSGGKYALLYKLHGQLLFSDGCK